MSSRNIAAIHDRIDEEHFELRLHARAIDALQRRVIILEAAVRELREDAWAFRPTSVKAGVDRSVSPCVRTRR